MRSTPSGVALGVDVGGTKVLGVAVNETGGVVGRILEPTPQPHHSDHGASLADVVASVIHRLTEAHGVSLSQTPIGVGLPGMMSRGGILVFAPNLPSASGIDVAALLEPRLGGARVAVAAYDGQPRNPVLIAREHWAEVIGLAAGDVGARPFLRAHQELVTLVECGDTGRPDDVDTADDLARLARPSPPGPPGLAR